ncbi:MAG: hypothetical protein WC861_05745 [Candidatus Micrarchaeia archaeon]
MRKSTILGAFVLVSYIVLFFGLFGDLPFARAGVGLLVLLDMVAFLLTLPQEYVRLKAARNVIKYIYPDSGSRANGLSQTGHRSLNTLLTGALYSIAMAALVLMLGAILPMPNLGLSVLICLLSGMLIVRMQAAYDFEAEGRPYFQGPRQ